MKKLELSEVNSNLLLFGSVGLSLTPFLLGDQLHFLVTGFVRDGLIGVNQFWHYLGGLFS
jgi:hypothetical protein